MRISDWSSDVCSSDLYLKLLGTQGEREAALRRARDAADVSQQVNEYVVSLFDAASPEKTGGKPIEPRKLVDLGQAQLKRSEEHTSELQSLMRISYAVVCLKNKTKQCTSDQNCIQL